MILTTAFVTRYHTHIECIMTLNAFRRVRLRRLPIIVSSEHVIQGAAQSFDLGSIYDWRHKHFCRFQHAFVVEQADKQVGPN